MTSEMRLTLPRWVDFVWLIALSAYIVLGVPQVPFHGDESTQLYMSRDFYLHGVDGNLDTLTYTAWDMLPAGDPKATQQDLRLKDGTVAKYLYGFAGWLGGYTVDDLNEQWLWGAGWEYNQQNGHVPSDDLLIRARVMSALLMALGVMAIFAIGNQLGGRPVAYLASVYLALNPALLLNGRRAMMEGGLLFFGVVVIWLAFLIVQKRARWHYVALGFLSGLAVATKHTAVVFVAMAFAMCGIYFLLQAIRQKECLLNLRQIVYLGLAGVFSLIVFYAANPVWWGDPIARAGEVLDIRTDFIDNQLSAFGGYPDFASQISGFWQHVFVVPPMYAETDVDNFVGNLAPEIAAYEASIWDGIAIGGSTIGAILLFVCVVWGIIALWKDDDLLPALKWMAIFWLIGTLAFVLFVTPLEWQRYYLPAYPPLGIFAAIGLVDFASRSYHRLRSNRS